MNYHVSSIIHLSLEKYYNAGILPERSKELIESIPDPGSSSLNLWCTKQCINHNWDVRTLLTDPESIEQLVWQITDVLDAELERMKNLPRVDRVDALDINRQS